MKQVKERLQARWNRGFFLSAEARGENLFPLEVPLSSLSAGEITDNYEKVRSWIEKIRKDAAAAGVELAWKEINHRLFGRNSLPRAVVFDSLNQLAEFLGVEEELARFRRGREAVTGAFPALGEWTRRYPFVVTDCFDDLEKLLAVTRWVLDHPRPAIYLRQLPVPGVDTKFIEARRKVLSAWFDILLPAAHIDDGFTGAGGFERRYGFSGRPGLVRFRLLDPAVRLEGFSDLTVTVSEFAAWEPPVRKVFVVENDITALAFPPVSEALLIFGRGYGFSDLSETFWLQNKEIFYWGDLDTHGFAILNQFRGSFPHTRSFLMDRDTLMRNKVHWGYEDKPSTADLPRLTPDESALYDDLRYNRIQEGLRLEQERIEYRDLVGFLTPGI